MSRIAAVLLNWHDDARTIDCVSFLRSELRLSDVWVVDNESEGKLDDLSAGDERIRVRPVPENRGFAAGMNVALTEDELLQFDYVLAINTDARIDLLSLQQLLGHLESNAQVGIAAPLLVNPDGSIQSSGGRASRRTGKMDQLSNRPDYLSWACVLLRTAALVQVGPLDEGYFMYWEDFEYSQRLKRMNWTLSVVRSAKAVHELSASGRRAGVALRTYYAWGLLRQIGKSEGELRIALCLHLVRILGARIALRDLSGLVAVGRGLRLARQRPDPAFQALHRA